MPALEEIRRSIEDQIADIEGQVAALTAALKALDGDAGVSTAQTRPRRRAARSRAADRAPSEGTAPPPEKPAEPAPAARRRRRRDVLSADQVAAMLAESGEGLSAIAIAKQAPAPYNRVVDILRELQAAGRARRQGTRRTSRWMAISDEERIQARAAELASRSAQHMQQS